MKLSKAALNLWGKKSSKDGNELWLPLIAHLIDTKNVINWLYNHWLTYGQKQILLKSLSESELQKLVNFLGSAHDLGKACPAFQCKQSMDHDQDLDNRLIEKLVRSGFTGLDSLHLQFMKESPHAVAGEAILEHYGLNEYVGAIIGGHHGIPQDRKPSRQLSTYTSNYWQSDTDVSIQEKWQNVQKELIDYILDLCGYHNLSEVPAVTQPQAVILEGLLIMADWLASCQYFNDNPKRRMFTLINLDRSFADLEMEGRFRDAISNWNIEDQWQPNRIVNVKQEYKQRWGFYPRPVQLSMSQAIQNTVDPGLIIVEAPMGIGKTEIALAASEQLASVKGTSGLFFGLPTQATANAMFTRVADWIENISQEQNAVLPIKLMHSKAQFNEKYKKLTKAENVQGDHSVVINSWFSGKKSILEEFSIGTIDNLLQMSLKQKHLFLKHLGLSGKVIIIDEIHAYDAFMGSYLNRALMWLGAYHVPVIALSATLPISKRNELITSYCKGKYGTRKFDSADNWKQNEAYPLLSILDGKTLKQISNFAEPANEKKNVEIYRLKGSDEDLIQKVLSEIKDGGVAGIIVNTVKRAQKLSKLLPSDLDRIVLHSAFLAPDRTNLEKRLEQAIGKNGTRPKKLVVIGTQVLEQSLDIDFDVLFTDIAPIDLIIQRIGRLHRHQIKRPPKLEKPKTYILGINGYGDYGDANEAIYSKYLLMLTDHFLPGILEIPDDISKLVQEVYSEKYKGNSILQEAYQDFSAYLDKEKQKAKQFQIAAPPKSKRRSALYGWLSGRDVGAESNEVKAEAAVRDIRDSLEVILLKQNSAGDYQLLNGMKLSQVDSQKVAEQVIRLPVAITPNIDKVIDSLETETEKRFHSWQQDIWLRGSLAVVLDNENYGEIFNWKIHYSQDQGLSYEKME